MLLPEGVGGGGEGEELGEFVFFVRGDEGFAPGGDGIDVGLGEGFDDFVAVVGHGGVAEEPVVDAVRGAGGKLWVES